MYAALSNAQAKQFIDAAQIHDGLVDARAKAAEYKGSMHWKSVGDRQYLYRTNSSGNGKSLGPRSEVTEKIYEQFANRKRETAERLRSFRDLSQTSRRINAALRLGSLPNPVADVCERLCDSGLMGKSLMVIGTNAMHAYESMAGVRFTADLMATVDLDLLWNHKTKLSLAATREVSRDGLIGLLRRADKTYEPDLANPFRARAGSGFMVDLIRQMPDPPWADEPDRFFENDLVAVDIKNMKWLLNAPRIEAPVIAVDGRVVPVVAPDPRAFAVFKAWLSGVEDRDPLKKERDLQQARAVIQIIEDRLPHLNKWGALASFPAEVMTEAAEVMNRRGWLRPNG